jgi:hypothetical protein
MRTYSDLVRIPDLVGRYEYLREYGQVGVETFGFDRWLNQRFYTSREWRHVRQHVIARDLGCDLGIEGREIWRRAPTIHHMNPIKVGDLTGHNPDIFDPEYLITVSFETHNAIHFGSANQLEEMTLVARRAGDTRLW